MPVPATIKSQLDSLLSNFSFSIDLLIVIFDFFLFSHASRILVKDRGGVPRNKLGSPVAS